MAIGGFMNIRFLLVFCSLFLGRIVQANSECLGLIGPEGRVVIFYTEEEKVYAIKCDDYSNIKVFEERTFCMENPKRTDSWAMSLFKRHMGVKRHMGASLNTEDEERARIQELQNTARILEVDITDMENFIKEFGEKAGNPFILKNKKEKLTEIQKKLNAFQDKTHPDLRRIDQNNSLIDLISKDTCSYLVYGNKEQSFAFDKFDSILYFSLLNESNPFL